MTYSKGFTLIELMVAIAIVAIVASIAMPAYTKYSTKAKISEGMLALDRIKNQIEVLFYSEGQVNPTLFEIQTQNLGKYIKQAGVEFYNTSGGASGGSAGGSTTLWVQFNQNVAPAEDRCLNLIPILGVDDITFVNADLTPISGPGVGAFLAKTSQLIWECRTSVVRGVQTRFLPQRCLSLNTEHTYCP